MHLASLLALLPEWLDPEKIISRGGYLLIFGIVFAESGLLIGFFLPGDSLLFTAGMFAAGTFSDTFPNVNFNIYVLLVGVFIAAVAGDPGQPLRRDQLCQPDADRAGQRMIQHRGDEDPGDDRYWPAQPGSQHEGQQLRLVADFGDGDEQA